MRLRRPWLRSAGPLVSTAIGMLVLLSLSPVFAQVVLREEVKLSNGQTRTVTFQGAADADVNRLRQAFRQAVGTAKMKNLLQKVADFTVRAVRDAGDVNLGREDQASLTALLDLGDLERAERLMALPEQVADPAGRRIALPDAERGAIRQAVADSLLQLILAHEIAGLTQPGGHVHEGPGSVIDSANGVVAQLRAGQRLKVMQVGTCFAARGVTEMNLLVDGVESAPGRAISSKVKVVIKGDVLTPNDFFGGCGIVERTFTVNSTIDAPDGNVSDGTCDTGIGAPSGVCTLRAALTEAEQTLALDEIRFDIDGENVPTIQIGADVSFNHGSLGALRPVIIDGATQPGGLVEVSGVAAPPADIAGRPIAGLDLVGEDIVVMGLAINRFPAHGIHIRPTGAPSGGHIIVAGTLVGTDTGGTVPAGNGGDGIRVTNMPENVLAFNVVSGNMGGGIVMSTPFDAGESFRAVGNLVLGNAIGMDFTGTAPLGNGGDGVAVLDDDSQGNELTVNAIGFNGGLGIALGDLGVPPNDPGDADVGPNGLQNVPLLTSATSAGDVTTANGTLEAAAATTFELEFFANDVCDLSGFGEGARFVGSDTVTTNAAGFATFAVSMPVAVPVGQLLVATATDESGNTSGLSRCVQVSAGSPGAPIQALLAQVQGLEGLRTVERNLLVRTLQIAERLLGQASVQATRAVLGAFAIEVRVLRSRGRLADPVAASLIAQARALIDGL